MLHPPANAALDERKADWPLTKRLMRQAKPYWKDLGLAAGLLLLITLGEQAKPMLVKQIVDGPVKSGDPRGVLSLAAFFMGSIALVFLLQAWQTVQTKAMGQGLMQDLRRALFNKIHAQPLRYFDKNPVGALMTRVVYDVETLNQLFTAGVSAVFQDLFTVVVIAVVLIRLDPPLALVALSTLPALAWSTLIFRRRARENYRTLRANNAKMNAFLTENLAGMSTVQVFQRQQRNAARFDKINLDSLGILLKQIRINATFLPLAEVLSALAIALALYYGAGRHLGGKVELGVVVATVMYIQRFFEPLRDLAEKYNIFQSAMASSERIFALLDSADPIQDPAQPLAARTLEGRVDFEGVYFAYEEERWALKGLSFSLEPGQRLAVVGPTGAGKSSLFNVLLRFYPYQKGRVLLDGQPLEAWRRADFRRQLAYVPQDPFLFSGSVLENLRLSDGAVERAKVEWAAAQVGAHEFIASLPQGYDTLLSEGGASLSTGQKQLLAFARALVFEPRLLLLDEATASVDTATEAGIQKALEVLLQGRSSITIAHRLSTVRDADRILLVKDGVVAEQGSHAELMRLGGAYRGLVELQFKGQEGGLD